MQKNNCTCSFSCFVFLFLGFVLGFVLGLFSVVLNKTFFSLVLGLFVFVWVRCVGSPEMLFCCFN